MTGKKETETLENAQQERGSLPESITVGHSSEFSGRALEVWSIANNVRLRDECLNVESFSLLEIARQKLAKFREHYQSTASA